MSEFWFVLAGGIAIVVAYLWGRMKASERMRAIRKKDSIAKLTALAEQFKERRCKHPSH
jgi:hypothetical protein